MASARTAARMASACRCRERRESVHIVWASNGSYSALAEPPSFCRKCSSAGDSVSPLCCVTPLALVDGVRQALSACLTLIGWLVHEKSTHNRQVLP